MRKIKLKLLALGLGIGLSGFAISAPDNTGCASIKQSCEAGNQLDCWFYQQHCLICELFPDACQPDTPTRP